MLKSESLVVLSKHVRSLLVHDDHGCRAAPSNSNKPINQDSACFDPRVRVSNAVNPVLNPVFNAASSGHGPGVY